MGYFDKIVAQNKSEADLEVLKSELKELFKKRREAYSAQESSSSYLKALKSKRENIIQEFESFFQSKGFVVTPKTRQKIHGVAGAIAKVGDVTIEIDFDDNKEFRFYQPGVFIYKYSLIDAAEKEWLNIGYENSGDVTLLGEYSAGTPETLLRAKKDLKKEIQEFNSNATNGYSPKLKIEDNESRELTESFTVILTRLNDTVE